MSESFADLMRAAGGTATAELPDGARLAVELRARLSAEGLICDEVFADDDGWCFFVSTQQAPVGVVVTQATVDGVSVWHATAQYEGGLSSIWSEQQARRGLQLALRIQARLDEYLGSRVLRDAAADDSEAT